MGAPLWWHLPAVRVWFAQELAGTSQLDDGRGEAEVRRGSI